MSLRNLVLLGATPAHLDVLHWLATHQRADTRVHFVAPETRLYSADMLPGLVAGRHTAEECEIALHSLVKASGAQYHRAQCASIDARQQTIGVQGREGEMFDLRYQWLSVGGALLPEGDPVERAMPGARSHAMFVRPLANFIQLWPRLLELGQSQPLNIALIGGDTAAVELALALQGALPRCRVTLVGATSDPPQDAPQPLRAVTTAWLRQQGITALPQQCTGVAADHIRLSDGATLACDAPIVLMQPAVCEWLSQSGLALDEHGRVRVNAFQQSTSHPSVFAGGELAALATPAGVAPPVQARTLCANLEATLADLPLHTAEPARRAWVSILGGERGALCWGRWCLQGRALARLRDRHDRRRLRLWNSASA